MKSTVFSFLIAGVVFFGGVSAVHGEIIGFDSDKWVMRNAQVVQHLDRTSLIGFAFLEGVEFENGVIEVDVAVDGRRSYPGIVFRLQNEQNYERFYIRPHRAGLYPDALQYTPVINGIAGWQLYNGSGCTAGGEFPENEWFHVKIEVHGKQARVYLEGASTPALEITDLKHGVSKGSIGVFGPRDGTAFFSNFEYRADENLSFVPAPQVDTPPGTVTEWELSQSFKIGGIELDEYPSAELLDTVEWETVQSEPNGLVDVARFRSRMGREPDCVLARRIIKADQNETKEYLFGYSDMVTVFLNGKILFSGVSAYQHRDPSFLGVVGLFDSVYLPLEKGDNELLFLVAESCGGWGFMCREAKVEYEHTEVKKTWQSSDDFLVPESAVYDAKRDVLYVTNYDMYGRSIGADRQFVSKISADGQIEELKWVTGLIMPAGMIVSDEKIYVVERGALAEIDIESREIANRYPFPQPGFPNDVTIDNAGNMYISDTRRHMIYKFAGGEFEEWLSSGEIQRPNGLQVHGDKLLVGNTGDNCLKSVDLASKEITTILRLEPGIIDGIKVGSDGNYIVSQWEGRVYRITPKGERTRLLDLTGSNINTADLDYIEEKNLLIIPTFVDNRILAYKLQS
ncbi:MAG: SMP-30/gluconolactonase/LRE family protein [Candidatus Latescibacterota bacterium]|nr:MAG: SMP-30/gluconolactonase/LRE family protein [Candidatus Latescibacterota bacterium]